MNWTKIGLDALRGLVPAAMIDLAAFRRWKSFDEAVSYDWGLAAWRWFQGAVVGIAMGFGLGGVQ